MPHSNVIFSSTGESPDFGFRDWEIDSAAATSWTQRQEKMTIVLSAESFQDITNVNVFTRVQVLWKTRGLWLTQEAGREKNTHIQPCSFILIDKLGKEKGTSQSERFLRGLESSPSAWLDCLSIITHLSGVSFSIECTYCTCSPKFIKELYISPQWFVNV